MSGKWITPKEPEPVKTKPVDSCAICVYYHAKSCRRYPRQQGDFYPISPSEWCGEFRKP